jgi:hypothetical protein
MKLLLRLKHRLEIQREFVLLIVVVIVEILREDPVLMSIIKLRWGPPPGQAEVSIKARVMLTHSL